MDDETRTLLALLRYDPRWLEYGFLDADTLQADAAYWHTGEDPNREHYRYAAFRHVLASRPILDNTQVARYVELAEADEFQGMAQSALADLIEWRGLNAEQFDRLSRTPTFAAPRFQKLITRRRLLTALEAPSLTPETFDHCLVSQDDAVQRKLLDAFDLTPEQLQELAQRGVNRAVRNCAAHKLRYPNTKHRILNT